MGFRVSYEISIREPRIAASILHLMGTIPTAEGMFLPSTTDIIICSLGMGSKAQTSKKYLLINNITVIVQHSSVLLKINSFFHHWN